MRSRARRPRPGIPARKPVGRGRRGLAGATRRASHPLRWRSTRAPMPPRSDPSRDRRFPRAIPLPREPVEDRRSLRTRDAHTRSWRAGAPVLGTRQVTGDRRVLGARAPGRRGGDRLRAHELVLRREPCAPRRPSPSRRNRAAARARSGRRPACRRSPRCDAARRACSRASTPPAGARRVAARRRRRHWRGNGSDPRARGHGLHLRALAPVAGQEAEPPASGERRQGTRDPRQRHSRLPRRHGAPQAREVARPERSDLSAREGPIPRARALRASCPQSTPPARRTHRRGPCRRVPRRAGHRFAPRSVRRDQRAVDVEEKRITVRPGARTRAVTRWATAAPSPHGDGSSVLLTSGNWIESATGGWFARRRRSAGTRGRCRPTPSTAGSAAARPPRPRAGRCSRGSGRATRGACRS